MQSGSELSNPALRGKMQPLSQLAGTLGNSAELIGMYHFRLSTYYFLVHDIIE